MLAGVAIGAGTGAVTAARVLEPLRRAGVGCELCSLVFAGAGLNRPEIGRMLFENGPFWICDSRSLLFRMTGGWAGAVRERERPRGGLGRRARRRSRHRRQLRATW